MKNPGSRRTGWSREMAGIFFLIAVNIWLLVISWRKWPDPVIDCGRELYIPWRLASGDLLYRDVDSNYGPLSQYFNALIFRCFGPGFMHLVWVDLAVQAACAGLIYRDIRIGWGRLAAFASTLVFIVVFSFSHFDGAGGYNFASPYSHESTHGFLLILVLIHLCLSWVRVPGFWKTAAVGICCGLAMLLKVEIIFAAALITLGTIIRADWRRNPRAGIFHALLFLVCAAAPSAAATVALWRAGHWGFGEAFVWANLAWTGVQVYRDMIHAPIQAAFSGLDHVGRNLATLLLHGGFSLAMVFLFGMLSQAIERRPAFRWLVFLLPVLAIVGAYSVPWLEFGKIFPLWLGLAAALCLRDSFRREIDADITTMRWLFLLAAAALLSRMPLNPRIYHYGYFQAAFAGIVITATLFRAVPDWLALHSRGRVTFLAAAGGCLAVGLWLLAARSAGNYRQKTQPIGEGADRFFCFPAASFIEDARRELAQRPQIRTLLVVPEGVALNYLSRRPTTTPAYSFVPVWLHWREGIVEELRQKPPDAVILVSRDMPEYGVLSFGETPEHGRAILDWMHRDYRETWQTGGDPLQPGNHAAILYERK